MQADNTAPEEPHDVHPAVPPVIVGIAYNESRKYVEKIHGKEAVIDPLGDGTCRESLEDVVPDDNYGSYPAHSVQKGVVGLAVCKCRCGYAASG